MSEYETETRNARENRVSYSTWPCCGQLDEDVDLDARINRRTKFGNHRADYASWPCCSQLDDDVELLYSNSKTERR